MRFCFVLFLLANIGFASFSQDGTDILVKRVKPVVDSQAVANWEQLSPDDISSDGAFFSYKIDNRPLGHRTLVLAAVGGGWQETWVDPGWFCFTEDGRQAIIRQGDSLCLYDLKARRLKVLGMVKAQVSPQSRQVRWLGYQLKNNPRELLVLDLSSDQEHRFVSVLRYGFEQGGHSLVLITETEEAGHSMPSLDWVDLESGKTSRVWSGDSRIINWSLDGSGRQLVFMTEELLPGVTEKFQQNIWYYKVGMAAAELRVGKGLARTEEGMTISGGPKFSRDGQWILFDWQKKIVYPEPISGNVRLNIWSYKDSVLQPEQQRRLQDLESSQWWDRGQKIFTAIVRASGGRIMKLERDSLFVINEPAGNYMVVGEGRRSFDSWWWPWWPRASAYLLNLQDDSRWLLKKQGFDDLRNYTFSPGGRWLLYYDQRAATYYSIELSTGKKHDLSTGVSGSFRNEYGSFLMHNAVAPPAAWLPEDEAVLLYDNYDLWQVDPSGRTKAVNLTNGYGFRQGVKLRLLYGPESPNPRSIYAPGDTLWMVGFSVRNKNNGFFRQVLGKKVDPKQCFMGPYLFYRTSSQQAHGYSFSNGLHPMRASKTGVWLVRREAAGEAPNCFLSKDNLRSFIPLTDLQPQRGYNWLKSELVTWKMLNGEMSQGVLYKPENFDPKKKYPVLFNYYEQLSHRLNEFPTPEFTRSNINIPWFVSRGYLVFTPDIHYKVGSESGKPVGEWAYNAIVSAALELSKRPYVDAKRLGLQGHSFGGGETNYLITHSHLFRAAAEAAGVSDPLSAYLTLIPLIGSIEHSSPQSVVETDHSLYGASPWERPELYQKSSAVLHADKVTTPLLIMHNEWDNNIQWRQGIEFYMALRRLGKKCWMLQYEGGGHALSGKKAMDYTQRLEQFFDYYLKGALPPRWMTEGMPAWKKGVEMGFELDGSGKIP